MKRPLLMTFAAIMLSATLSAEQYDRLLDAIDIPDGVYFDTDYVVKNNPRVIADMSADWTAGTEVLDVFGVARRGEGCWILNLDVSNTSGQSFYYIATALRIAAARSAVSPLISDC